MTEIHFAFATPVIDARRAGPVSDPRDENGSEPRCQSCPVHLTGLCGDLELDELNRLFRSSSRLNILSGHELIRQGEPSRHVHMVLSGGLMLSRLSADGHRFVTDFAWPGDFVGAVAEEKSSFSAFAMGPTKVCRHPHITFDAMVEEFPRLARSLFLRLHDAFAVAQEHMAALGCKNSKGRVALFLVRLQERQAGSGKMSPRIDLPMRRFDVAAHLGLTVETVSRVFQDFVRRKIIMVIPDGVRILARDALAEIADVASQSVNPSSEGLISESGARIRLPFDVN